MKPESPDTPTRSNEPNRRHPSPSLKFKIFPDVCRVKETPMNLSGSSIQDDAVLLAGVAAGNEAAFNQLFGRYRGKLYGYLLKITKSPEIAEEIVIDIFMKLWVGRQLIQKVEHPENFLHKIAYHKAIDFLRTAARHTRLRNVYIDRMKPEQSQQADDVLIDSQSMQLLHRAILSLPPRRRLIYTLSREEGLTYEQIAAALNLSRNTVKNSMMAAVKSIAIYLRRNSTDMTLILFFFKV